MIGLLYNKASIERRRKKQMKEIKITVKMT